MERRAGRFSKIVQALHDDHTALKVHVHVHMYLLLSCLSAPEGT